jgi:hypothetical protein
MSENTPTKIMIELIEIVSDTLIEGNDLERRLCIDANSIVGYFEWFEDNNDTSLRYTGIILPDGTHCIKYNFDQFKIKLKHINVE